MWNTSGLVAGDYILKLTVKNNLNDSIETFVPVSLLASVVKLNNYNSIDAFSLIPNPANEITTLHFNLIEDDIFQINMIDISGKNISTVSEKRYFKKGKNVLKINVEGLCEGIYFISLQGEHQTLRTKLVVNSN